MSTTPIALEEHHSRGIGLVLFAQLFFTTLDTSAKWLAVSGIPTGEIVFVRYAVHVVLILIIFLPRQGLALFRTRSWPLEVARGLALLGVTAANFLAMRFLPLTVTGALLYMQPLLVCVLSIPMLGERVGWRRWLAIGTGFVGVLIIVRPGTEAFQPASLLAMFAALCAAFYAIFTRKLAGVDTAATQQLYAGLIAAIAVIPFAFSGWQWPSDTPTWVAFFAAGAAGMTAHQLNTIALRHAPPSLVAPFGYAELILLAIASWLIFKQPPEPGFYLGAPIIIGSGVYIWLRERQLKRTIGEEAIARE